MLDWIVRNRTVYLYKNGFGIKQPIKVDMPKNSNQIHLTNQSKLTKSINAYCYENPRVGYVYGKNRY